MGEITLRPSKDEKAVIIGGKRFPLTQNNLDAWNEYKATHDNKRLWFKLSTFVLDTGETDPTKLPQSGKDK